MTRSETTFLLDTDPALLPPLVDQVQRATDRLRLFDETNRVRVAVALQEALTNALYHGNLNLTKPDWHQAERRRSQEPYRGRRLRVDANLSTEAASFTVRDEGPGFDHRAALAARETCGLGRDMGRGLVLMRMFMDELSFNEAGNEVTLVKRR